MKAYFKDINKEIKRTRKRFISIIAIVILGVAFYVGINTASPDMLNTYNQYINDYNLFDLNLMSTVGFDKDDLEEIAKSTDKIDYIEPIKTIDAIVEKDNKEKVIKVMSIPKEQTDTTINKIELLEGKYPENKNQIILDNKIKMTGEYKIGDTIEFISLGENSKLEDTFSITRYTIVGFANSPLYVEITRGTTTLADGSISGFAMVLEDAFSMEQYTNIYAKVKTNNNNRTSDEYIEEIKSIQEEIEHKTDELAENKYNEIYNTAKDKIQDAKQKVSNGEQKLLDAQTKLDNAKNDLASAEIELNNKKKEYNTKIKKYQTQIMNAENKLVESKQYLDKKQQEIDNGFSQIKEQQIALEVTEQLALRGTGFTDIKVYLEYLKNIAAPQTVLDGIQDIISGKDELEKQNAVLEGYKVDLQNGLEEYNQGISELNAQKQELEVTQKQTNYEFKLAENKISIGWSQLQENTIKFEEEKEQALQEIENAKKDIEDGEKRLEDLKVKIYVLNLETNQGYVSYKSDCQSVKTIGKVFPIIFFLVAALVSLTAMTRMVEENRGNIGTYKSLGYSRPIIALKYVIYSVTATVIGIILGTFIGSYTLPWVISEAYGILYYTMPTVIMNINIKYALIAGISAFSATTISTILACYRILRATPAKLMRPKTPKEGKKILLEKIPVIWKHFTFTQKITARNVFRYKKRLYMTIIGIAGCTALIFTGFGLRNSITAIVTRQYGGIRTYDFEITLKNELSEEEKTNLNSYIENNGHKGSYTYLRQQTNDVSANEIEQNVYVIGVNNQEELSNFVKVQERKTKQKINIDNEGVVITEKLAKLLNVRIDDEINIKIDDETNKTVKIAGIAENYVYHYVYMTKTLYEEIYNEKMIDNQIYLNMEENNLDKQTEEEISSYLLENKNISQVTKISSISESFSNMVGSLDTVVIVLITCAGLLAFVVLYNLNSINIEERKRELATIKLLGFYNKEVSNYVFRENIVLTIIGALMGLVLGVYLHLFVISTAEVDIVMFGREKTLASYIIAFVMTVIFAIIINLIMSKDLKKIDMIESLKSVE